MLRQPIQPCITCRRQQQDVIQPIIADLSKGILQTLIYYTYRKTGVDYLEPFFIKVPHSEKRYLLLFTCLVTRAIHIEVTEKRNTDDSILAIRNFICRRANLTPSDTKTQLHLSLPIKTSTPNKSILRTPHLIYLLALLYFASISPGISTKQ